MRTILILICMASAAWAQNETYGHVANSATKIDMSAALSSRPVPEKASDPATCTEGMRYYNTTLHKGRICTATDTWADEASAGSGNMTVTAVTADPTGACTAGTQWWLRTDVSPPTLWFCGVTGTPQKVLSTTNTGQFAASGATGSSLGTPSAGIMGMWFDSTSLTPQAINENGIKSTMVIPSATRTANQFATHLATAGSLVTAAIAAADLPAALANSTSVNGTTIPASKTLMATDTALADGQLAAKFKAGIKSIALFDPVTGDSGRVQFMFPYAVTITSISCSVKAATSATINLDERAFATPDTIGTSVLTSDLACDIDGATSTTFTNAGIAANVPIALLITAVSGTPDTLRVFVTYTID